MQQGSCYVPRVNAIFIGRFNLTHGAEEAAHFVNFALKGQRYGNYRPAPMRAADEFYLSALEEALGYFGSKLIDPRRNHLGDSAILNGASAGTPLEGFTSAQLRWARRFVVAHKKMERDYGKMRKIPAAVARGLRCGREMFNLLAHELGYLLGEQLYRGYLAGAFSRRDITRLMKTRFEECGPPAAAYLDLAEQAGPLQADSGHT
jgi:hypothetical protein